MEKEQIKRTDVKLTCIIYYSVHKSSYTTNTQKKRKIRNKQLKNMLDKLVTVEKHYGMKTKVMRCQ